MSVDVKLCVKATNGCMMTCWYDLRWGHIRDIRHLMTPLGFDDVLTIGLHRVLPLAQLVDIEMHPELSQIVAPFMTAAADYYLYWEES